MLRQIVINGVPAGVQNSIISVANVFVQLHINTFGATAVAGCGSYSKDRSVGFLPVTCFALALTTFISQNLGAREYERFIREQLSSSVLAFDCRTVISDQSFAPVLIGFGGGAEAVLWCSLARIVTWFYFLLAFSHCMAGILRGAGKIHSTNVLS